MLGWDGCYGLDETPFSCIVDEDPDMMALFEKTLAAGKVVTGHVAGASEAEVQAFVAMGGTVDHEAVDVEETFARARSGMKVLMRFGSRVPDLPNLIGAYTEHGMDPRQLSVCTDVLLPETLAAGALDVAVRRIIAAGVQPMAAIAVGGNEAAQERMEEILAFRRERDPSIRSSVANDVLDTPTHRTFTSPSARLVETLKSATVGFKGILTVWYITSG